MEIKTTLEIFQENEIIEPTEDEYGRKGRSIPLKYCNPNTKDKKWVVVDDIVKRVNDVGIITISRPSRLDSETMIEVTEKLTKIVEELTKDQNNESDLEKKQELGEFDEPYPNY